MRTILVWSVTILALAGRLSAQEGQYCWGEVTDSSGAPVPGASLELHRAPGGVSLVTTSGIAGQFHFAPAGSGSFKIRVSRAGFATVERSLDLESGPNPELKITLQPAVVIQELLVSANLIAGIPEIVARTPGSVDVLDPATLRDARVFGLEEALRKVAGVYARPEEGFSLRPNIGIRGLNPNRSSKVLLLEDGVPLAYAPYGDNASYYHPPVDRFESIEVVKGSGQIAWGPNTVGGVINYVTPPIPAQSSGSLTLTGGSRDYLNGHFSYGRTFSPRLRSTGILLDAIRKQGAGARDNVRSGLNDFNLKSITPLSSRQALALKVNHYTEDSRLTYSGLRLAEWQVDPRGNPFRHDSFRGRRWGASAVHNVSLRSNLLLTTTAYKAAFHRDWWRQSSNSAQRPNDSADPACGGMANLDTTCGNEGRLRNYEAWGIDPRVKSNYSFAGLRSEFSAGMRAHLETQDRTQLNGSYPEARTGVIVEDNRRRNQAFSGFVQNSFALGSLTVTPGLRIEHVRYHRTNRLYRDGVGVSGKATLTQAIPGIGVAWTPSGVVTAFAGLHRGFAPPRTEDIISNSGGFVELDSELSWNYEAGIRTRPSRNLSLESTFFRMDYSNQIIPASIAGGVGAALTSAGHTLHQGFEFSGRLETRNVGAPGSGLRLRAAATWVPTARFEGTRFSSVAGFKGVPVSGNRLPYSPGLLLNATAGFTHRSGADVMVELVQTGRQYSDDLNTVDATADGQGGVIPGYIVWNATLNVPLESWRTTAFVTVKNVFDRLVLVDRSRGMLPGSPRLLQAGLRWSF